MIERMPAILIAALVIGACATTQPASVRGTTSGYICDNASLGQFVGREATQALGADMLAASGARTLRWVRPGMAVTMDFREDRVTVYLDSSGRVERASCG